MRLLLIEPANKLNSRIQKNRILENLARKKYFTVPPLSLGILAALTPPDWEIKIIQEPRDVVDFDGPSDFIGISAVTNTVRRGYEIAGEFRKRGKKVIMGGIHPTALPDEALQFCDSVCIGEAENLWKEILNDFSRGNLKRTYRADDAFDMKNYTSPRRDLMHSFNSPFFDLNETIEASRGCPYDCDFCSVSLSHGRKIRYRTISNIIPEIESIRNNNLFFVDNNIIANFNYAKELFRAMIPLRKKWTGQATISISKDAGLLRLAADSGCRGLLIGIESVTDEGIKHYKKNLSSFEELKRAIRTLKEYNIGVLAHMVFGNDFDTIESIRISLERLLELEVTTAALGIIVPYPGTKLYENLVGQNRIRTKDWNYYDIHHMVFEPLNFTTDLFLQEIETIRKEFFSYPAIFKRACSFGSFQVLGLNIHLRSHNKVGHILKF